MSLLRMSPFDPWIENFGQLHHMLYLTIPMAVSLPKGLEISINLVEI